MKVLKQFDEIADSIADKFDEIYFDGMASYYWIGDDRTGLIHIDDHFFVTLEDMVYALKNTISAERFFEYYEKAMEGIDIEPYEPKYSSLRHYIKSLQSKNTEDVSFFAPNF